jgi:hypothetical protein
MVAVGSPNPRRFSRLTRIDRTRLQQAQGGGGSSGGGGISGTFPTVRTDFTYGNADRVTGATHARLPVGGGSPVTLATYAWTWDSGGQLTQEVSNGGTANFTDDNAGQLTGVSGWRTESYSFDNTGNRNSSGYATATGKASLLGYRQTPPCHTSSPAFNFHSH